MVTFSRGTGARAKAVVIDGIRFASQAEGRRYSELKLLEKAGQITNLTIHPKFEFVIDDEVLRDPTTNRKITYSADFMYHEAGSLKVEDVKGWKKGKPIQTPEYRIKKALMWAIYLIKVIEVKA